MMMLLEPEWSFTACRYVRTFKALFHQTHAYTYSFTLFAICTEVFLHMQDEHTSIGAAGSSPRPDIGNAANHLPKKLSSKFG